VYTLQVYALVTVAVFTLAGLVLLALMAANQVRQYARARKTMHRILSTVPRERLALSKTDSQPDDNMDIFRAA
jgi:hypothetical protein